MSNNTGEPAFPSSGIICDDGILYEGMTLRDYFAAKAMQTLVGINYFDSVAKLAYQMADEMLKAREE